MKKVAVFVDWDNLKYIIRSIQVKQRKVGTPLTILDYNNTRHISKLIASYIDPTKEELYRIFFYTAKPLNEDEIRSKLRRTDQRESFDRYCAARTTPAPHERANAFLSGIVKEDYIALRTGKLQVRGVDGGGAPDIVQKQVDMLIGLDISEVSYNKHADVVLVFSKDTDMIPALKTARINGLTVVIANFSEIPYIAPDIIKHSDLIRTKSLIEIDLTL